VRDFGGNLEEFVLVKGHEHQCTLIILNESMIETTPVPNSSKLCRKWARRAKDRNLVTKTQPSKKNIQKICSANSYGYDVEGFSRHKRRATVSLENLVGSSIAEH
jgi:hypothetical protein